ncbi:MAG: class A beta-lactamase-related serine hydrolase [Gammaproteobacteria bacterium]|nr:MAG: class A beta-lactamase-related serine hydrolase [Gammaproteobacteria bacterium]
MGCDQGLFEGRPLDTETAEPAAAGLDPGRLKRLDDYIAGQVESGQIAGAQVMLARHDLVVHNEVFGFRDLHEETPVTHDTLWRIYSMTKPVTSVAAMMLHEEGQFELDDPLADFLPEYREMMVWNDGNPVPAENPITIRQLFTHSAGFSYGFTEEGVDALYREAELFASEDLAAFSERLAAQPLLFEPGSRWHYGVATDVLGRLVEVISGQSLDRFLGERLFDPLGMVDTFFEVPEDKRDRFGAHYRLNRESGALELVPDGSLAGIRWQNVQLLSGGGGLVSTADDYMRFARMLLNGGAMEGVRILSPKTVAWMARNHLPADLESAHGVYGQGDSIGFGLGFAVVDDAAHWSGRVAAEGEYWWGGAAGTLFWADPEYEVIGILMLQRFDAQPIRQTVRTLVNAAIE